MTHTQIELVQQTWKQLSGIEPILLGTTFYNRLFTLDPSLRALFRSPIPEQSKKLVLMLNAVIRDLDRLDDLLDDVRALGQRHSAYGVQAGHYETVGKALLLTLEKALYPEWNEEKAQAWQTAYDLLASAMTGVQEEAAA